MTAPTVPAGRPPLSPSRRVAAYENWRPPVVGISLLVLVGVDNLLVADTTGRGDILLPVGPVQNGQTLGQAAQQLLGRPDLIPVHRRVVLDHTQTRRRTVTTHLLATRPCSAEDAAALTYRDPRAVLRVLPTSRAVAALPERARARTLLGLQALATGRTAYLIDGTLSPTPPAWAPQQRPGDQGKAITESGDHSPRSGSNASSQSSRPAGLVSPPAKEHTHDASPGRHRYA